MHRNGQNTEKGSALAIVLIMMTVIMILMVAVFQIDAGQARFNPRQGEKVEAVHYAEAGINKFLWAANKGTISSDISFNTPINYIDGVFQLESIQDTSITKRIRSFGYPAGKPELKRIIDVTIGKKEFTQFAQLMNIMNGYYATGEKLYGPIHSNGNLLVWGTPEFFGQVTYVNSISGSATPNYHGLTPRKTGAVVFPTNNSVIQDFAKSVDGYFYQGRTLIYLKKTGGVTVVNNGIKEDRSLPANGVIYVAGTGRDGSNVEDNQTKFALDRGNVFISGWLSGKLTIAAENDIYITAYDPTNSDLNNAVETNGIRYANTDFSLNTTTGKVTVTGSSMTDMLGLIANNNVFTLAEGWPMYTNTDVFMNGDCTIKNKDLYLYGSVFAIRHQISNEMISRPNPQQALIMRGAIISNEVGVTQDGNISGYTYDLAHDPRMMYETPPKFIEPLNAGWSIIDWKETN